MLGRLQETSLIAPEHGIPAPLWVRLTAGLSPIGALGLLSAGLFATVRSGTLAPACVALALCLALLVATATWFTTTSRLPRRVTLAMWATAGVACLGWAWQRAAYLVLVPDRFLSHGYFRTAAGSTARFYMMEAPLKVGAAVFFLGLAIGAVVAWRAGARWSIAALVFWWLTAYVVYAAASLYLWAQGDAGVFI